MNLYGNVDSSLEDEFWPLENSCAHFDFQFEMEATK